MAREGQVRASLTIRKTNGSITVMDENRSASYTIDVSGTKGPTPADIDVTPDGVDIDLSQLSVVGWCWFKNRSAQHYIQLGRYSPSADRFFPFMRLGPGQELPVPLDPDIIEEYEGTGTGTTAEATTFRAKSPGGATVLHVGAYEA